MTDTIVTEDRGSTTSAEATGHPTQCEEPALGKVEATQSSVTITDTSGTTRAIATTAATIAFTEHAHDHSTLQGCHNQQTHEIDPQATDSLSINGNAVLETGTVVGTDPVTGGDVTL